MLTVPKEMRAVVYRGANDLRVETVPVPKIGPHEILVKVVACGVCPTDIKKIQYATVPPPRIFGHETAGIVARVGVRVSRFKPGDRVALHHHVPCLECHACRHRAFAQCAQYKRTGIAAGFEPAGGGYAEYVRVMPFVLPGVVKIPSRNSFLEGAMLEPVNTVLKAVKRLELLKGDAALVAGQGPIGLMFTRLLTLAGVKVTATDLLETRLEMAKHFGAAKVIKVKPRMDTDEHGSDAQNVNAESAKDSKDGKLLTTDYTDEHGSGHQPPVLRSAFDEGGSTIHYQPCAKPQRRDERRDETAGEQAQPQTPINREREGAKSTEKSVNSLSSEALLTKEDQPPVLRSAFDEGGSTFNSQPRYDAAVIAVPSDEVVREAQELIRGGGKVLLFSHTRRGAETKLDLAKICVDEKDLIGSYSADFLLQEEVARLVFSRKLDVRRLITHEFPLERTAEAISLASRPTAESLKIVVTQTGF